MPELNTPFTLTPSQENALNKMRHFITDSSDRCFVLRGYAGTGKTTIMRFLLDFIDKENEPIEDYENQYEVQLLSTTGRAAKILSNYTGRAARTIHSMIYNFTGFNKDLSDIDEKKATPDETGQLFICWDPTSVDENQQGKIIYIIDESSMISDTETKRVIQSKFGSGKLLSELLYFDTRPTSKFIFVGDPCQLPPIEGTSSPALDPDYLRSVHHQGVQEAMLTEVMRQQDGNRLTIAASNIRTQWKNAPEDKSFYVNKKQLWGMLPLRIYANKEILFFEKKEDMINDYSNNIKLNGYNDSVFICNSNTQCAEISSQLRKEYGFKKILEKGDLLMVTQNQIITGLMNGDFVEVVNVSNSTESTFIDNPKGYAYRTELGFREVTVKELFTGKEYTTMLLEHTLNANIDERLQTGLYLDFIIRMRRKGITQKKYKEFKRALETDPYLNALRCSYGYAVTCHKAQGGEWRKVYIDFGRRNFFLNPTKESYQWLYTALTRAKQQACFVSDFYFK